MVGSGQGREGGLKVQRGAARGGGPAAAARRAAKAAAAALATATAAALAAPAAPAAPAPAALAAPTAEVVASLQRWFGGGGSAEGEGVRHCWGRQRLEAAPRNDQDHQKPTWMRKPTSSTQPLPTLCTKI